MSNSPPRQQFIARREAGVATDSPQHWLSPFARLCFLAFVFSLPFETLDVGVGVTPSKVLGWLFLFISVGSLRRGARPPWLPLGLFGLYVALIFVRATFLPAEISALALENGVQQLQMLVFYGLATAFLTDASLFRQTAICCLTSSGLAAALQLAGVGVSELVWQNVTRVSFLGENPNNLGFLYSVGLLCSAFVALTTRGIRRWIVLSVGVVQFAAIVATGSRGALLACAISMVAFILAEREALSRFHRVGLVAGFVACLVVVVLTSEAMSARIHDAMSSGSYAQREEITPTALELFGEKPLFGWGPIENTIALGRRMGEPMLDTHNLALWYLTEMGIFGTLPLLAFFGWIARGIARSNSGRARAFAVALAVCTFAANMSGSLHARKQMWLALAFCTAAGLARAMYLRGLRPQLASNEAPKSAT